MFRYKKSIPVSYERQGYIYFSSLLYRELPEGAQRKILNLCLETGGEYYQALFEFVTTDAGAQAVCLRHHLSPSVLERAVRRYTERKEVELGPKARKAVTAATIPMEEREALLREMVQEFTQEREAADGPAGES